ncbi:MAG: hypothetical protein ACLP0J_09370 [Solirubrobacteraceae bacterium]
MQLWEEHGLKLVAVLAAVVAIAVLDGVLGGDGGTLRPPGSATSTTSTRPTPLPPGSHSFEDGDESGPQVKGVKTTPAQRPAVQDAARAFMADYLPFSYGQAPASSIQAATSQEREDLEANPPQVPAAVHRRHPRVAGVRLRPYAAGEWQVTVTVTDGTLSYPIVVVLGDLPAGWEVMAIQD